MANIDLVPKFWKEHQQSRQVVSGKRVMVERFARWLDKQAKKESRPKSYTNPIQSATAIHRQVDDN